MNKRPVKVGLATVQPMTYAQAQRYAQQTMPPALKAAGFKPSVFVSDAEINGGLFYRINWSN